MAQFVIENSGSLFDTTDQVSINYYLLNTSSVWLQVSRIHHNLSRSYFHWKVRFLVGVTVGGLVGFVFYVSKKVYFCFNFLTFTDH